MADGKTQKKGSDSALNDFDPDTASIDELRVHIRNKRSALDAGLGELQRRVQPDYLTEHVVDSGKQLLAGQTGSLVREAGMIARQNPLGTALTIAGLALLARGYLEANGSASRRGRLETGRSGNLAASEAPPEQPAKQAVQSQRESQREFQRESQRESQREIEEALRRERRYQPAYRATDQADDHVESDRLLKGAVMAAGVGIAIGGYVAYQRKQDSHEADRDGESARSTPAAGDWPERRERSTARSASSERQMSAEFE